MTAWHSISRRAEHQPAAETAARRDEHQPVILSGAFEEREVARISGFDRRKACTKKVETYYVYIITNKGNTTLYIGVTNDLRRRMYEHAHELIE